MSGLRTIGYFLSGREINIKKVYEILDTYNLKQEKEMLETIMLRIRKAVRESKPYRKHTGEQ